MKFVPAKLTRAFGKLGLKVSKKSPEILLVVGIGTGIASTVSACRATLKAEEVLDAHRENMDSINQAFEECPDEYTAKDKKKDTAVAYGKTIGGFVKLYSPAIILGAVSITSICASYGILKKRNAALTAAYAGLLNKFKDYRQRVKDKYGEDVDREIIFDETKKTVETDDAGNVVSEKYEDAALCSQYARFFDSANVNWYKSPEYNMSFLKTQQDVLNDRLKSRGYIFLNEVYDALGFQMVPEGQLVGWFYDKKNPENNEGDGYIDFGIHDYSKDANRRFVNGYENVILLDFNVDGVIYDKI